MQLSELITALQAMQQEHPEASVSYDPTGCGSFLSTPVLKYEVFHNRVLLRGSLTLHYGIVSAERKD